MGIEMKSKGIFRCLALRIENCGTKQLKPLFEKPISKEAKVRTDKWRGYKTLKSEYKKLKQKKNNPKQNFKLFHRKVMMVKGWLRGIHHSEKNCNHILMNFATASTGAIQWKGFLIT